MDIKSLGARGNGTTDDTAAIQAVLDAFDAVECLDPQAVFLVSSALMLKSQNTLDLGGATLKAADWSNCSVIEVVPEAQDVTLKTGVIDGNVLRQKIHGFDGTDIYAPTVHFTLANRVTVKDLEIKRYRCCGLRVHGVPREGYGNHVIDSVTVDTGIGPGASLAGHDFEISSIKISNTSRLENDQWGAYPNSITLNAVGAQIESIVTDHCEWGVKIQNGSKNVAIKNIEANWTAHAGVKIQGDDSAQRNNGIIIESIDSSHSLKNGLYVWASDGVDIGSYRGDGNGRAYQASEESEHTDPQYYRDVWLQHSEVSISRIESKGIKAGGVDSRLSVGALEIGSLLLIDHAGIGVNIKDSINMIGSIFVERASPIPDQVVYVYGGVHSGLNTVRAIYGSQSMAEGETVSHVYDAQGGGHLEIDSVVIGGDPAYSVVDNVESNCA